MHLDCHSLVPACDKATSHAIDQFGQHHFKVHVLLLGDQEDRENTPTSIHLFYWAANLCSKTKTTTQKMVHTHMAHLQLLFL